MLNIPPNERWNLLIESIGEEAAQRIIATQDAQLAGKYRPLTASELAEQLGIENNGISAPHRINLLLWALGYIKPGAARGIWEPARLENGTGIVEVQPNKNLKFNPRIKSKLAEAEAQNKDMGLAKTLYKNLYA